MIAAALPGFLIAAGVLAAVPVALHFLARRPPRREALPTARFLTDDPRTLLRLQRKPTDAWLLALRVAFALALGAAFAGLTWTPERSGSAKIVLVDAGADPTADWAEAVEAVRSVVEATGTGGVSGAAGAGEGAGAGGGAGTNVRGVEPHMVLAYGLDDGWRVVELEELSGLGRGSRPATVEDALRALRAAAAAGRFAEAEATWVGRASWRAWSSGFGLMRTELWPGRVAVRPIGERTSGSGGDVSAETGGGEDVSAETSADGAETVSDGAETAPDGAGIATDASNASEGSAADGRAMDADAGAGSGDPSNADGDGAADAAGSAADSTLTVWLADALDDGPLRDAVEALGGQVVETPPADPSGRIPDWIFARDPDVAALAPLLDHARSGAALVLSGRLPAGMSELPWVTDADGAGDPSADPSRSGRVTAGPSPSTPVSAGPSEAAILLGPGDRAVGDPVARLPGSPAPGARTVATFDDAMPAAAARPLGEGCAVYLASDIATPELAAAAEYPALVRALALACADDGPADGALDLGALQAIERPDLPATVDVAALVAADGVPLTRWLIVLAIGLLGLEVAMTRERRA